MKWSRWFGAAALAVSVSARLEGQPVQIDINTAQPLHNVGYGSPSSVGWYFTPSFSFFLSAIHTKFNSAAGSNLNRTVTVELWSERPAAGGSLLASAGFQSNTALGTLGGGSFAPLLVQAGLQYFIGFRNISGLGVNYTKSATATSLGNLFYSLGPAFNDDKYEKMADPVKPVLRFIGRAVPPPTTAIPEPITMSLIAIGLVGLGGAGYLRRRRNSR